jgi:hypothetical protein
VHPVPPGSAPEAERPVSAPTREAWGPSACGCADCAPRLRRAEAPGCPCRQGQPGPGINFLGSYSLRSRMRTQRIDTLLRKKELTPQEEAELDDLLHSIIHG